MEVADCEVAPKLIKKTPRSVKRVLGDGAYDTFECYRSAHERGCELLVPPRSGAVLKCGDDPWVKKRNESILEIIGLGNNEESLKLWKKLKGYHRRSLVETSFSRFKFFFWPEIF